MPISNSSAIASRVLPASPAATRLPPCAARSGHGPCIALGRSLRNALALALKHQVALESGDGAQHSEHQLPGWAAGVDPLAAHAEHNQSDAALLHLLDDVQQVAGGARQPIRLGHHQHVALADELQRSGQLGAVGQLTTPARRRSSHIRPPQIAPLGRKAGRLLYRARSCISDQHSHPPYRMRSGRYDMLPTNSQAEFVR